MYEDKVKRFHLSIGKEVPNKPVIPAKEIIELRLRLIREELAELEQAIAASDIENSTKELCDLQYVVSGAVCDLGLNDIFYVAFDEVHQSNMSKTTSSARAAALSVLKIGGEAKQIGSRWAIFREDGKLLKPITYCPADLSRFFTGENQTTE